MKLNDDLFPVPLNKIKSYTGVSKVSVRWAKLFSELKDNEQKHLLSMFYKEQTKFIIRQMENEVNDIQVAGLGRFAYKEYRRSFVKLKAQYPEKTTEEIQEMIKSL
jgi:hypothetical protein